MSDIEERLRTERDEATKACRLAIKEMADMARDAGSWRGIAEGKDIVIRQLEGERDRLRADVARCEASLLAWVEAVGECNKDRDRLREALRLADAALSGANMNMGAVEKKVRAALGESDAADYATVPKEPTQRMLDAGEAAYFGKITDMASVTPTEHHAAGGGPMGYAYRAMLAAAKETGHE